MKRRRAGKSTKPTLLWLDSQREATHTDLLIRLDYRAFFARKLSAGNQGWISAFGSQPEASLIVKGQRRVHAADLWITFQGQIHRHRFRAAADSNLWFSNLDDCLPDAFPPKLD